MKKPLIQSDCELRGKPRRAHLTYFTCVHLPLFPPPEVGTAHCTAPGAPYHLNKGDYEDSNAGEDDRTDSDICSLKDCNTYDGVSTDDRDHDNDNDKTNTHTIMNPKLPTPKICTTICTMGLAFDLCHIFARLVTLFVLAMPRLTCNVTFAPLNTPYRSASQTPFVVADG